ncbi:MAG: DUF1990 domain-containing protein [Saprospiraceae bacterium]|nr:DUF1990 domain-containing protein [Saprospiraceae bacterium]MCB0573507.1 DUF1990 domain-containing protein [Saprospiraceae bacterium]MCB9353892.1 DUF1990 domain-containing protein [Lewinellaceae bacterium]
MLFLKEPAPATRRDFISSEEKRPFSYGEVGLSNTPDPVAGFDNDLNVASLGQGDRVWEAAKEAIRCWKMFPGGWANIWPDDTPIREGGVVTMAARVMGLWWLNSCRIVYVIDNDRQFGFAYGTLPGHVECGEELFLVERDGSGAVQYSIRAFSRPRHWLARLGYPLARAYQRKFVRDSQRSMINFIQQHGL